VIDTHASVGGTWSGNETVEQGIEVRVAAPPLKVEMRRPAPVSPDL
jgi:hypothetical protein